MEPQADLELRTVITRLREFIRECGGALSDTPVDELLTAPLAEKIEGDAHAAKLALQFSYGMPSVLYTRECSYYVNPLNYYYALAPDAFWQRLSGEFDVVTPEHIPVDGTAFARFLRTYGRFSLVLRPKTKTG